MIKNKLHNISDEDAIEVAKILLINSTFELFSTVDFDKIQRIH